MSSYCSRLVRIAALAAAAADAGCTETLEPTAFVASPPSAVRGACECNPERSAVPRSHRPTVQIDAIQYQSLRT